MTSHAGKQAWCWALGLALIAALLAGPAPHAGAVPHQRIAFHVTRCDLGQAALEGHPGVIKVSRGLRRGREISTVIYDPGRISQARMVALLKKSNIYQGIAVPSENITPRGTKKYN